MSYQLITERLLEMAATQQIEWHYPDLKQDRKRALIPIYEYNILVDALNVSRVLLAVACAFTFMFSFTNALIFAGAGFFLRQVVVTQRVKYFLPPANRNWLQRMIYENTEENNLFTYLRTARPSGWVPREKVFFGLITWENKIPL